jgi:hypothetical protein
MMVACFVRGGSRLSPLGRHCRENKLGDDGRISGRRVDISSAKKQFVLCKSILTIMVWSTSALRMVM